MELKEIKTLIEKYNRNEVSEEERDLVIEWYDRIEGNAPEFADGEFDAITLEVYRNLQHYKSGNNEQVKRVRLWPRIAAVAAAVALIVLGVYFFNYRSDRHLDDRRDLLISANDIAPGKNGATLTLTNGKQIKLNDVVKGEIAGQAGVSIVKTANGQVMYQFLKGYERKDQLHGVSNTLSTGKGETYIVILPDGTKVWLNAVSSLKFDPQLHSHGRVVKLTGEAYFEVAKDKKRPFIVISEGQQLEVLGTHFNVNTYGDEHNGTVTSLLEGSVKVTGKEGSRVLKPGERGVNTIKGVLLLRGDAQDDIDWKEGRFVFDNEPLEQIMAKVSRWYDVEIVDDRKSPKPVTFKGSFSRYEHVSKVLSKLEFAGDVKFKIEGRKITITK
ncbi:FecR family protein [Pedobacter frigoris]|uniref:FecR family protein n=1 Tax=Pedobacter frigoris TaxID=2571272 RepID=UPI00292E8714|nr:FecR domain-containing protein [Pedobacter frigoris]